MPSTFAVLADQRKVALQEGEVRHRYSPGTASPALWLTGLLQCSAFSYYNH